MATPGGRALDHLVFPVGDLQTARTRYQALGFTVAPNGRHPFGTENANIFFPDGTFLEPLAVADAQAYASAQDDNTFVRNDRAARAAYGDDGFSHIVLSTEDANADDRDFSERGVSGGPVVRFSRAFRTPDGAQQEAEFLLAFASRNTAPDGCFFTCETVKVPSVDRSSLLQHANGAIKINKVISCMEEPFDIKAFIQKLVGEAIPLESPEELRYALPNTAFSVFTPAAIEQRFGVVVEGPGIRLRHSGFVVAVMKLAECRRVLEQNEIDFTTIGGRLVVHPVPGQGAFIVFEDMS